MSEPEIRVVASADEKTVVLRITLERSRCIVQIEAHPPRWIPKIRVENEAFSAPDFDRVVEAARKGLLVFSAHFDD